MYTFQYNHKDYSLIEINGRYHLEETLSTYRPESDEKRILKEFLIANGYDENELNDDNKTTSVCRKLVVDIFRNSDSIVTKIDGPEITFSEFYDINKLFLFNNMYHGKKYLSKETAIQKALKDGVIDSQELNLIRNINNIKKEIVDTMLAIGTQASKIFVDTFGTLLIKKREGVQLYDSGVNLPPPHCFIREYIWLALFDTGHQNGNFSISIFIKNNKLSLKVMPKNNNKKANTQWEYDIYDRLKQSYKYEYDIEYDPSHDSNYYFKEINQGIEQITPFYKKLYEEIDNETMLLAKNINNADFEMRDEFNVAQNSNDNRAMENNFDLNMILYGPPGTGKTYNTKIYAVAICDNRTIKDVMNDDYETQVVPRFNELIDLKRIQFVTFHQSYSYEDFIEGIRPIIVENLGKSEIFYDVVPGIFKLFCEQQEGIHSINNKIETLSKDAFDEKWSEFLNDASQGFINYEDINPTSHVKDRNVVVRSGDSIVIPIGNGVPLTKENAFKIFNNNHIDHTHKDLLYKIYEYFEKKYLTLDSSSYINISDNSNINEPRVFIIDEINRGKISKIFGELITLIEPEKRLGEAEAQTATLPYSKKQFGVPNNIYILGTMNTADRSIAIMDTALRRRFHFIEMMPDSSVIKGVTVNGLDVQKILDTINSRIEVLYDRDHTIGHAYFTSLKDKPSIEELSKVFKNKVLPLLQEYFYEDYEKIRLILGDNNKEEKYQFIKQIKNDASLLFKGKIDEDDIPEYTYSLNEEAFNDIESYRLIIED